jgi:hypothetical protein
MSSTNLFDSGRNEIRKVVNLSGIYTNSRRTGELSLRLDGESITYDARKERYTVGEKNYLSRDPGIQGVEDAFTSDERSWEDLPIEDFLVRAVNEKTTTDPYDSTREEIAVVAKAASGDSAGLKNLLDGGASANARLPNGISALHGAVRHGEEKTTQILVREGADVNYAPSRNETPLKSAIEAENYDVAEALMEEEIDRPGIPIENDLRPVHFAASNGKVSLFKKLIEQGTPLKGSEGVVSTIACALLTHREGDFNSDRKLCTILKIAAKEGDSLSGEMLRDEGWMLDYAEKKCSGISRDRLTKDDEVGEGCL